MVYDRVKLSTLGLFLSSICIDPAQLALKKVWADRSRARVLGTGSSHQEIKGLVPVVLPCRGLQGAPLSGSPRGSLQPWDNWENSRFLKGSSEGLVHLSSG